MSAVRDRQSKAIFVTGLPRCGSSWVGQVLASSGQARYVYEPFNARWNRGLRGRTGYFKYLPAGARAPAHIEDAARRAFAGQQNVLQLARAAYRGYWSAATRRAGRVLVKDPTACLLSGWLARQFDPLCVVIHRHPCGFASSHDLLGWQPKIERLLHQPRLVRHHLQAYLPALEYARSDRWLAYGAFWGAAHRVLLDQAEAAGNWLLVSYEQLCLDSQREFAALGEFLDLPLDLSDHWFNAAPKHRRSDPGSTRRDSAVMASVWRERLSPMQIDAVLGAAAEFDLEALLSRY